MLISTKPINQLENNFVISRFPNRKTICNIKSHSSYHDMDTTNQFYLKQHMQHFEYAIYRVHSEFAGMKHCLQKATIFPCESWNETWALTPYRNTYRPGHCNIPHSILHTSHRGFTHIIQHLSCKIWLLPHVNFIKLIKIYREPYV